RLPALPPARAGRWRATRPRGVPAHTNSASLRQVLVPAQDLTYFGKYLRCTSMDSQGREAMEQAEPHPDQGQPAEPGRRDRREAALSRPTPSGDLDHPVVAGAVPGWLARHAHCPVIVVP